MKDKLKYYIDEILNIIYPQDNICMICNYYDKSIYKKYICKECLLKFKKLKNHNKCRICSKSLTGPSDICIECIENPKYFKKLYTNYEYEGLLRQVIKDFKYNNKAYYYKLLGGLLYDYIKNIEIDIDIITFVPLHKNKKRRRGYNQSELLAKYLSEKLNIKCKKLIERRLDTVPQNTLRREARLKNLKNTFFSLEKIKNKNILIVDDVYTTGTTINECSKTLMRAEAQNIYGLTLGR